MIENSGIDWQVDTHEEAVDDDDDDDEEESGEEEEEDEAGVRLGKFGNMEVVADDDEGDAFDEEEYKRAMAALRKGRMMQDDLRDVDHD